MLCKRREKCSLVFNGDSSGGNSKFRHMLNKMFRLLLNRYLCVRNMSQERVNIYWNIIVILLYKQKKKMLHDWQSSNYYVTSFLFKCSIETSNWKIIVFWHTQHICLLHSYFLQLSNSRDFCFCHFRMQPDMKYYDLVVQHLKACWNILIIRYLI